MAIGELATSLVPFLVPFLPYLLKAGEKVAEEAGRKLGEAAWEQARALWRRLRPKVEAQSLAQEAVKDAAVAPQDEDARAFLRLQLKKILAEDEVLAAEVARLWEETKAAGMTVIFSGGRSVGGVMSDSAMATGDGSVSQRGKYNVTIGRASGLAIGDKATVNHPDEEQRSP